MEEQIEVGEVKEGLERLEGFASGRWGRYLALSTALIAVLAAVASLVSGYFATHALLAKNDALLMQIKASDTWNEYQSKSIKIHLLEGGISRAGGGDSEASLDRYRREQSELKTAAAQLESRVEESNRRAEAFLGKHHTLALSVTTFQTAIALSAISALLRRRAFWVLSMVMALVGIGFFTAGLFS
jgi:uncharacterized protein DUF4337